MCRCTHAHRHTHRRTFTTVKTNGFKGAKRDEMKSSRKVCLGTVKHCGSLVQETVGPRDEEDAPCGKDATETAYRQQQGWTCNAGVSVHAEVYTSDYTQVY